MISFSLSLSFFFLLTKVQKTVIVQSPPLLVAFTCMFLLRSKKRKLILNVSDLWPLAGLELGVFQNNFSYKILEKIESFNYNCADLILGQSEEILTHIKSILPNKSTFLYRNIPIIESPPLIPPNGCQSKIKLVYAGLLGVAQGIYELCKNLDYANIEFHIYGSGRERDLVELFIKSNPELPLFYHGEVSRIELHEMIIHYDIALIPLLNRIYGSVPSKIFEYSLLGLPILYFGGGEGEGLVLNNGLGWVADAGSYKNLNDVIQRIERSEIDLELKERIMKKAHAVFDLNTQLDVLSQKL